MTARMAAAPFNSRVREISGGSIARCTFKSFGIRVEQGRELKQPCFRGGVPRLAGNAPCQFRFQTDGGNRFLGHKPCPSPRTQEEGPPAQGRGQAFPLEDFKRVSPRNRSQPRSDESGRTDWLSSACQM